MEEIMKRNYKVVNITFNLDKDKEQKLYDFLNSKNSKTGFIKDLLQGLIDGNPILTIEKPIEEKESAIDLIIYDEEEI